MLSKKLPAVVAALAASVAVAAPAQAHVVTAPPDRASGSLISAPVDAHSGQIIAVLIGLEASPPLTAPLGSTKGSFLDASTVYGSADYQREPTSVETPN